MLRRISFWGCAHAQVLQAKGTCLETGRLVPDESKMQIPRESKAETLDPVLPISNLTRDQTLDGRNLQDGFNLHDGRATPERADVQIFGHSNFNAKFWAAMRFQGTRMTLAPFNSFSLLNFSMLANANLRGISVEATGHRTTVPEDPYIVLGYYLHCVASTDLPEEIPQRLRDWQNMPETAYKSNPELREMIAWADGYSPQKMQNTGYFTQVPDGTLGRDSNKFFIITSSSTEIDLLSSNRAALALVRNSRSSIEVMLHIKWWENDSYHKPRQALIRIIEWREGEARRAYEAQQHLTSGAAGGGSATGNKKSSSCNGS
jgi:hypothetical protein